MNIFADVGGTKIRFASHKAGTETFSEPHVIATPQTYEDALHSFTDAAAQLCGGESLERLIVGIPAVLSRDRHSIIGAATHIKSWFNKNIADDLKHHTQAQEVYLENDVALVGLGEAVYGAGKGARIVMYLTVSTGVNGVRIVDGHIDQGVYASTIGHQYLSGNPQEGTWESKISGSSIEQKYGVHPRDLGADSPVWEELAAIVAQGVHNSILHWSPDRLVLGGSMFNEIGISPERVRLHLENIMKAYPELPEIQHSSLHDFGGLWGALARLKQVS